MLPVTVSKYGRTRFWAVRDGGGELICVCVYKRGAMEVARRLGAKAGMRSLRHPLVEGFCAACKPADRRPPWEWCEEHVQVDETSPLPGRWRSDASPWVRAVMEDFSNSWSTR
jgi:hypothetical protein